MALKLIRIAGFFVFRKSETKGNYQCFQIIRIDLPPKAGKPSGVEQNRFDCNVLKRNKYFLAVSTFLAMSISLFLIPTSFAVDLHCFPSIIGHWLANQKYPGLFVDI